MAKIELDGVVCCTVPVQPPAMFMGCGGGGGVGASGLSEQAVTRTASSGTTGASEVNFKIIILSKDTDLFWLSD